MHRRLFQIVGGEKILLTKAEVAEFDQRELDAVVRRANQVPVKTDAERVMALEVDNELLKARLDAQAEDITALRAQIIASRSIN